MTGFSDTNKISKFVSWILAWCNALHIYCMIETWITPNTFCDFLLNVKENSCMSTLAMKTARQCCQTCATQPKGQKAKKRTCWQGALRTEKCSHASYLSCISSLCTAFNAWLKLFTPSQPLSWPIPLFQLVTHNESNHAIAVYVEVFAYFWIPNISFIMITSESVLFLWYNRNLPTVYIFY